MPVFLTFLKSTLAFGRAHTIKQLPPGITRPLHAPRVRHTLTLPKKCPIWLLRSIEWKRTDLLQQFSLRMFTN